MEYDNIMPAVFLSRPNRFIAEIEINGKKEICHVKNTGRCKELLISGAKIFVQHRSESHRKTKFDLISVLKNGKLINIDSQAPNKAVFESLDMIFDDVVTVKPEYKYRSSRIDFFVKSRDMNILMEVKGVTLEENGVVRFPDAPTERGAKHIRELIASITDGYVPYILFVIQMSDVKYFTPNSCTDPEFSKALKEAQRAGVGILAYSCRCTENSMVLADPVEVRI